MFLVFLKLLFYFKFGHGLKQSSFVLMMWPKVSDYSNVLFNCWKNLHFFPIIQTLSKNHSLNETIVSVTVGKEILC